MKSESSAVVDDWMAKLKAAYEAGYYKTEASEGQQIDLPWQTATSALSVIWRWLSLRLPLRWYGRPVRCLQCGRLFSTMTLGVRWMQGMQCWECHRVYVLHNPMMMATNGRARSRR